MSALLYVLLFLVAVQVNAFSVFWNVPTFECQQFGIHFNLSQYHIIQNPGDVFSGKYVSIIYGPGAIPQVGRSGVPLNGGVPQAGNLTLHLLKLQRQIETQVPVDFKGVGILDFESWLPVWEANYGVHSVYQKLSVKIVKEKYPHWPTNQITALARQQFEDAAHLFLSSTLHTVQQLRPDGLWGYYHYPYCWNSPGNYHCTNTTRRINDKMQSLFDMSGSLYPSIYEFLHSYTDKKRFYFVHSRLEEADRVASFTKKPTPIFPYFWYMYHDSPQFLSTNDLINTLSQVRLRRCPGVVVWDSTANTRTEAACKTLWNFVHGKLGPIVKYLVGLPISGRINDTNNSTSLV